MSSINMRNKQSTGTLSEKASLHVCLKSDAITKKSCTDIKNNLQTTNSDPCSHEFLRQDGFPINKLCDQLSSSNGVIDQYNVLPEPSLLFQQQVALVNSTGDESYGYAGTYSSIFQTDITPVLNPFELLHDTGITNDAGSNNESAVLELENDGCNDTRNLYDYQTCSISDCCLSNMDIGNLPFKEDDEPNAFFTMIGEDIMLPDLEDYFENHSGDISAYLQSQMMLDNAGINLAMNEIGSDDIKMSTVSNSDQGETFYPQYLMGDFLELSDVIGNFCSTLSSKIIQRRKPVTLVLDLDETLIHSSYKHCDDADFKYSMFYNLKQQTVYVKKRPHLHTFFEKAAEMFKVVIFTASRRNYSEQILNRLDPKGNLISERAYRDSCIFVDGKCTKDLTVLGVDLAKVVIIDNTPEVFRLQMNNGIPIKSWYGDPSDSALVSLLPFLETLADAEDVRPLIAEKFESVRHMQEDESKGVSHIDNNISYQNQGSYQPEGHAFEINGAEDLVTSIESNMQQLSFENDDQGEQSEEDNPPVIIPNHLQVHALECPQLSFGSFRCGVDSSLSGPFALKPSESNLDARSSEANVAAVAHSDTGNAEYYRDENQRSESTENLIHGSGPSAGNYDEQVSHYADENLKAESTENLIHESGPSANSYDAPVSQPEVLRHDAPEPAEGNQYAFSSSESGHVYENHQQLNAAAYSQSLTSPQMQNLANYSSVMQGYASGSAQSTLLPSSAQTAREPDLSYSPFALAQSMPAKYHTGSSINGPAISMTEALRAAASGISSPQPTQQIPPGANVASGSAVPQQLLHPYSQPSLPLNQFANMISYPFLPQNYTYMPPAIQQAFANNSTYNQSLAAMLPQYKNSVSASSLPQAAAVASGYGFGNSTNIPGHNFPLNTPVGPGSTTVGFDEVLNSQYKDNSHMMSLQQQNDNSGMWVHGAGSRNMPPVPANAYYSFPGQSQQPPGFRQPQQPSLDFGALGYPNYYQSGMPLEQQQNARDGSLGSQGQQVKQTPQLWQNGY